MYRTNTKTPQFYKIGSEKKHLNTYLKGIITPTAKPDKDAIIAATN